MDPITRSLLETFVHEQSLEGDRPDVAFEKFVCYSIISNIYHDDFDVEEISTGGIDDAGLDGIGVLLNGSLVTSDEEIDDLVAMNKYLEAEFIFVQAKQARHFEGHVLNELFFSVHDFFRDVPRLAHNERVQRYRRIKEAIFAHAQYMHRGNPRCRLFYVTLGRWLDDDHLTQRVVAGKETLLDLNLFSDVLFDPVDAARLQEYFKRSKNRSMATFSFPSRITLPEIRGITEAYLGIIPGLEYVKLIEDDAGNIQKSLFYANVRDFQGDNPVNSSIRDTIGGGYLDHFLIRNNGVTIVARKLQQVSNRFTIEDYQIVNGCQTSHVLHSEKYKITDQLHVPVKLIVADDDEVINAVIRAVNSQTEIREDELYALSSFQKKLEDYFNTFRGDQRLHYERRSKQYSNEPGIEKVRVVSVSYQIRYFAAMFLNEPHRVGRYFGVLRDLVQNQIFRENHYPDPYYTSAYAAYRLEWLFRNNNLDSRYRMFRYHILNALRYKVEPEDLPAFNSKKMERYCRAINEVLWDVAGAQQAFGAIVTQIGDVLAEAGLEFDRDSAKTQTFRDKLVERARMRGGVPPA